MSKKNLVIVESPAKAKTITKYLGKDFEVIASYGHIRDLPTHTLGVDVENKFEPVYKPIKGKAEFLKDLKKKAQKVETVWLATDPDREGEAIAWHLQQGADIPEEKTRRVVFNEITKTAVQSAIQNARDIDQRLVDAQQARRILDRLIGYRLSPILSKKIRKGLSAGRVQSVALKLICDREREILAFVPEEYWVIEGLFSEKESHQFSAKVFAKDAPDQKFAMPNETIAREVEAAIKAGDAVVDSVSKRKAHRHPAPPFITSTLQQEASRKLNWTAQRTMSIAQQLYEGLEVKGESVGLITYMRTDSTRVANEAKAAAKSYITDTYGEAFLPEKARVFKEKKGAQDAHEAIRPTHIEYAPNEIASALSDEQLKLYRLIWQRFMASQMKSADVENTTIIVKSDAYYLKATGHIITFEGFMKLYLEGKDDGEAQDEESQLPDVSKGAKVDLKNLSTEQKFTQPPHRFSEATLVKVMEEKGIGRPSTYAPTIGTIIARTYVDREGRQLSPTELGMMVDEKLSKFFEKIVDVGFTVEMETHLDEITENKHVWQEIVSDFYGPFMKDVDHAKENMEKVNLDKPSDEVCDKCGKPMVIKTGRFGEFLACTGFPECKNAKPIVNEMGVDCPDCSEPLVEKRSKRGKVFYGCSGYPKCKYASWDKPISKSCPNCDAKLLFVKILKGGKEGKTTCQSCDYTQET